ncbi:Phospholipid-transporting ATPase FetA [Frankliniella fusca]|uniref:Phospholipid-transporting ATPase FetA n=1 Tax=Frankliniella fusca TaxID=407009 RepID=A0AAE1H197_9NEOP|nr:Phospholipid-transporting ATPase FetA [Frankliniella fusca]
MLALESGASLLWMLAREEDKGETEPQEEVENNLHNPERHSISAQGWRLGKHISEWKFKDAIFIFLIPCLMQGGELWTGWWGWCSFAGLQEGAQVDDVEGTIILAVFPPHSGASQTTTDPEHAMSSANWMGSEDPWTQGIPSHRYPGSFGSRAGGALSVHSLRMEVAYSGLTFPSVTFGANLGVTLIYKLVNILLLHKGPVGKEQVVCEKGIPQTFQQTIYYYATNAEASLLHCLNGHFEDGVEIVRCQLAVSGTVCDRLLPLKGQAVHHIVLRTKAIITSSAGAL